MSLMADKNILFVVEGENDETSFISTIFKVCYKNQNYCFYKYKTNIHVLAKKIEEEYPDFDESDEFDIRLVLRSLGNEDVLSRKYTDIYLIFDFDPQHSDPQFEMVKRMMLYFNESYDKGKIFINYPMIQSYKHFSKLPDQNFKNKIVSDADFYHYKELVNEESNFKQLSKYDYFTIYSLAAHHLKKANYIINDTYSIPDKISYLDWDFSNILEKQILSFCDNQFVYVLNTSIFILIDYAPDAFFRQIKENRDNFFI